MALIVNMDIPRNCSGCCLMGSPNCPYDGSKVIGSDYPNCPIIGEIPDKHGRFIDVDAYIKTEMDNYRKHRDEYSLERAEAISDVLAVLDKYTPIVLEASE